MVAVPEKPVFLFVFVAFAYNLAWTAVGSLIRYYSFKYGAAFFVYLNVAFYAVGLPTSYIQRNYDTYYDTLLGSTDMFLLRVAVLLLVSVALLQCAPISEQTSMIFIAMGVGLCTWFSHGTVTNLSSIAKNESSTYQQVGFMLPGAFCILLLVLMDLDVNEISQDTLYAYYGITSTVVASGIVAWIVLCRSEFIQSQLRRKDEQTGAMVLRSEISAHGLWEYPEIRNLMRRIINASSGVRRDADAALRSVDQLGADVVKLRQKYPVSISNSLQDDDVATAVVAAGEAGVLVSNPLRTTELVAPSVSTSRSLGAQSEGGDAGMVVTAPADGLRTTFTDYSQVRISDLMAHPAVQEEVQRILEENSTSIVQQARAHVDRTKGLIYRARWSLFITIFCSILQGSFLAYVRSSNRWSIGTLLFFIRNFSDLSGRLLALLLPKPAVLMQVDLILVLAATRALVMIVFFLYVALPPGDFALSNTFIVLYQFFFSIFSGYFSCCLYELAAVQFSAESDRSFAGQLMSTSFQWACFLAVLAALLIVVLDDVFLDSMEHH